MSFNAAQILAQPDNLLILQLCMLSQSNQLGLISILFLQQCVKLLCRGAASNIVFLLTLRLRDIGAILSAVFA